MLNFNNKNIISFFDLKTKVLTVKTEVKILEFLVFENGDKFVQDSPIIPIDYIKTQPEKVKAFIHSKLQLNKTIYTRLCKLQKIDKAIAATFLNSYHFLNSANGAYNYGLFYNDELLCVASFSKGRKMNRLLPHERSFELIRFCTKAGITVTGGLTKLLKHFCSEKNVGDIMTYIDKQFSDGKSFIKAGFKLHSETKPNYFLINKKTFERIALKNKNEVFDETLFYRTQNAGNLKLVYTPWINLYP